MLHKHLTDDGVVDSDPDEKGKGKPVHQFRLTREQYKKTSTSGSLILAVDSLGASTRLIRAWSSERPLRDQLLR